MQGAVGRDPACHGVCPVTRATQRPRPPLCLAVCVPSKAVWLEEGLPMPCQWRLKMPCHPRHRMPRRRRTWSRHRRGSGCGGRRHRRRRLWSRRLMMVSHRISRMWSRRLLMIRHRRRRMGSRRLKTRRRQRMRTRRWRQTSRHHSRQQRKFSSCAKRDPWFHRTEWSGKNNTV